MNITSKKLLTINRTITVKGEAIPAHSTKTYGGGGGLTSLIINLYIRWRWAVSLMIRQFYSRGKTPPARSRGGWGGSHSGSKRFRAKYLLALPGIKISFLGGTYRGTDKSLARPDWKNKWKIATFRPTGSLLPRRPGWTDNLLNFFFLSGLQKLEFGRCSLLPSWSGYGLISTPVQQTCITASCLQ